MRFVEEDFLLLARSGRTPHALPTRDRGDPLEPWVREELRLAARARRPPRRAPLRAAGLVAGAVAGVLRRGTELRA